MSWSFEASYAAAGGQAPLNETLSEIEAKVRDIGTTTNRVHVIAHDSTTEDEIDLSIYGGADGKVVISHRDHQATDVEQRVVVVTSDTAPVVVRANHEEYEILPKYLATIDDAVTALTDFLVDGSRSASLTWEVP